MNILVGESKSNAWKNHPAVRMFAGHHSALYSYLFAIRTEMDNRGYKWENNWQVIERMMHDHHQVYSLPKWMNDEYTISSVITTHRGRLYEKAPDLYPQYRLEYEVYKDYVCCDKCTYHWPTHKLIWNEEL